MSRPIFPTKWHFLGAQVLFGVHQASNDLLLGSHEGTPLWVCFTDPAAAQGLPGGYVLRQGQVREVLRHLPDGVAVVVDPGAPGSMYLDPAYVQQLKPLTAMFPAGVGVTFGRHDGLEAAVRRGLTEVGERYSFVTRLWVGTYQVEDGPTQGLLLYAGDAGSEPEETVVDALSRVLDEHVDLAETDPPLHGVQILASSDLPVEAGDWLATLPPVYQR